jgi:hypothetical protein
LLDELKNREIFLATLEENNDPMDGMQDVYWDGDEVIWRNFIRHYCLCLLNSYIYLSAAGDTQVFDAVCVNTQVTPEDAPIKEFAELFEYFLSLITKDEKINDLTKILINQRILHKDDLNALFFYFNSFFLVLLKETIKEHLGYDALPGIEIMHEHTAKVNFNELFEKIDRDHLHVLSHISIKTMQDLSLIAKYAYITKTDHRSVSKENYIKFISFFPSYYLESSVKYMHSEYYVASFSEQSDHASMWSHYAHGHRGVCLVFAFDEINGSYILELEEGEKLTLHKVEYKDDPPKINVFENLGHLSMRKLESNWLTYGKDVSSLASKYRDSYPEKYWNRYIQKVTHKFPDWGYENEYRVVKSSWLIGAQTKEQRLLHYKSKHLKGVIFGYRTPEDAQIKIIQLMDRTLTNDQKNNFNFFRTVYSPINKKLEVVKMSLLKFNTK